MNLQELPASEAAGIDHWTRVKKRLRAELGEDVFSSWFARVDLEDHSDGTVRLSVPTRFLKQWIQSHYRERLMGLWKHECEDVHRIELTVRGAVRARPAAIAATRALPSSPRSAQPVKVVDNTFGGGSGGAASAGSSSASVASREGADSLEGAALDPKYTFGSFVEGESNALALAAARQVATAASVTFNPLYIHASVGLGKTHLMQAVASAARASGKRVLYLTAEHFMYRFVAALKAQSALAFKDTLRTIDLLLIDDMQFLHGKQVQQEFCHTLNALIDGARQVVVAADRPPADLETLDDRMRSRLAGGLVVAISEPDFGLRRAILTGRIETCLLYTSRCV